MISLQQQQDLLLAWEREQQQQRSPPASLGNSSLNCALENSMKVWQPTHSVPVVGDCNEECLGNAMNMTLIDWTKTSNSPAAKQGSDALSISSSSGCSGGGSRGASRTPSPFSLCSGSSASISGASHPHGVQQRPGPHQQLQQHPGPHHQLRTNYLYQQQSGNYGAGTLGGAESFMGSVPGAMAAGNPSDLTAREGRQIEMFSRKVFVGGLPPDIDQDEIKEHFVRFGPLAVDWPHKAQSKAYFPPKGYAFLLFRDEVAVHRLAKMCIAEEGKLFMFVSSVTQTHKKVQIRPWKLSDSDFIMDHTQPIDPRKTIFIGGVPRPLKAAELADIFNSRYGNVCYAGIDCDPELKYPKGAGRVTFSSRVSFMSAVSCRFLQVTYGDIDKKVEVKPYVLDDQVCDECQGLHCGGRYAPYFCGNIHCLRYYCEHCWSAVHSAPGTQNHRCFIKENGDRPRAINFFPAQPRVTLP